MCRILEIHHSGFYAWLKQPESKRAIEDKRLLGQIKQFWIESGFSYGYRNITMDMKDHGEACGKNRVHRIMKEAGIRSQRGYKRHRGFKGGDLSHVAPNILDREFEVDQPNKSWVTLCDTHRALCPGGRCRILTAATAVRGARRA